MGLFNMDRNPAPPSQPLAPPPSYDAGGSSSSDNSGAYSSDKKEPLPPPPAAESPYQAGQAGPSYQAAYGAVLLSSSDKIRLLNFPEHVIGVVGDTITRAWPPGIQTRGRLEYGGFEFKLKGRPWYGQGPEAVPARRLMIHFLHCMATQGWHLSASTDLSKKSADKDTLFFRAGPPVQRMFFSVSFNEYDKVRIIDPPNDAIKHAFISAVQTWPMGIQDQKEKEYGCYQIKLRGSPWATSNGAQVSQSRLLALNLMSTMDNLGYELTACVDMSIGAGDDSNDIDSWFFASKL